MRLQNDRIIMNFPGATTEVATLKQALSEAENNASKERTKHEKQEARVGEVQQELQDFVKKEESLERDSKTQKSELAKVCQSAHDAKLKPKRPSKRFKRPRRLQRVRHSICKASM